MTPDAPRSGPGPGPGLGSGLGSGLGMVPDPAAELQRLAALPLEERAAALAETVRRLEAALEATDAGSART